MKIVGQIFGIFYSIIFGLVLIAFMVLSFALNATSGNYYADVFTSIDLDNIKIADISELIDVDTNELSDDMSIKDALVKYITNNGVDDQVAKAIIENKEIKETVGKVIGEYVDYTLYGKKPNISRNDVKKVLTNKEVIKAIGETPSEEDISKFYDQIQNMLNDLDNEGNGGAFYDNSQRRDTTKNIINYER